MDLKRKISRTLRGVTFAAMVLLVASAKALAQNLPPPGAYQPIPNFTGVGAGLQFREAINERFSGAQPIAPTLVPITAAQLAAMPAINGGLLYCTNCQGNASCSSGGTGSVAFGMGGDWNCSLANAGGLNTVSNDTNVTGALSSGGTVLSLGWNGILPGSRGGTGCGAPVTYSALPASPVTGTTCTITDAPSCFVGTAITGGGSTTKCQITWNGANWMPAGGAAGVAGGVSNAVLYAANYSGATWAEQVEAASAALPSYGGTVDAQGLCSGTALATADETVPIGTSSKPIRLLLGPCTYPLGTNEMLAYQGAYVAGQGFEQTTISCTGPGTCIGFGNAAGNYGVTFEDFSVTSNSASGSRSIGINWSQLYQSQAWAVQVTGFDTGMNFGNGNTNVAAAYYDHIYNSHVGAWTYGYNFTASANQDSVTGGTVAQYTSGGAGILLAGQVDTVDNVDTENCTRPVEISGGYNVVRTGYANTFLIDSGAQNNVIFGTQGSVSDNSGNLSNWYETIGTGAWPPTQGALDWLGFSPSTAGIPEIGLFNNSNTLGEWKYGPGSIRETYSGNTGHAPFRVGGLGNYGGIGATGRVSTQPLVDPNAPTCTVIGTPGTATVKYAVQAQDFNGGVTLVSSDCTVTNAPNTLNGTNYIQVVWGSGQNYDGVELWHLVKNDTTAAETNGTPYTAFANGVWTADDNGSNLSFSPYTAPARNSTGDVTVAGSVTEGCAGQQALSSASPSTAAVSNTCITSSTNVIECTDCSGTGAPTGAIRCVPSAGSLAITGPNTITDTICWARLQ